MLATLGHAGDGVSCAGSAFEHFRDSLGQIILGHRGVDLDDEQVETHRFPVEVFREHPITFEQVMQGLLWITGLSGGCVNLNWPRCDGLSWRRLPQACGARAHALA
jgi:hypothetical protein